MSVVRTNRSAESVNKIRELFKNEYLKNQDIYYVQDYERILNDDWYVKRFLLARQRDVNKAFEMLKTTMKWRKEQLLNEIYDYYFPVEFYKIGGLFIYERDRNSNVMVYMRIRMHKKVPELDEYSKKFLIHVLGKADKLSEGNGVGVVFDLTSTGVSNIDWDYLKFLISTGNSYFPVGVKYVLVYNLPWVLNTFRRGAFAILPETWIGLLRFASGDEIFKFIPQENVPDYIGGTCKRDYRAVPKGSKMIKDLVEDFGYSQADIDRILPLFKDALDESEEFLSRNEYIYPQGFFDEPESIQTDEISLIEKSQILKIPKEATFEFINGELQANIIVQNLNDKPVAFKVKSNDARNYLVTPRLGIILPKSFINIEVKMKVDNNKGKLMIIAHLINELEMISSDFENIFTEGFTKWVLPCKKRINETKLLENQLDSLVTKLNIIRKKQQETWKFIQILLFFIILLLSFFIGNFFYLKPIQNFPLKSSDLMKNVKFNST